MKQEQTRLYHVYPQDAEGNAIQGEGEQLIEHQNGNAAFRAANVASYGVKVASTKDVIRLRDAGVEVKRYAPKTKQAPGNDPGGTGPTLPADTSVPAPKPEKSATKKK